VKERMEPRFDARRDAKKIAVALLLALFANVLFYLLMVRPRAMEMAALKTEKDTFSTALAALNKQTGELRSAYERIVTQEQRLDRFYNEILGTKQKKLVEIQKEIASITKEFGIDPQEVHYDSDDVPEGRVERFKITLPLQGDYLNLRQFIARVENSSNFLVIDRVALSNTKEGGQVLSLSVEIGTYFDAPWLVQKKGPRSGVTRRRGNA
jgi:Tfp pilus assembly protein PilO